MHHPSRGIAIRYQTLGDQFSHRGLDVQRFAESAFQLADRQHAVKQQKRRARARRGYPARPPRSVIPRFRPDKD
ncbi:MAG: hypothetical protein H6950_06855 [Zoogloeaceae bacterium]|nr:hypothetical protein [Zoogloeaceae bacterium]